MTTVTYLASGICPLEKQPLFPQHESADARWDACPPASSPSAQSQAPGGLCSWADFNSPSFTSSLSLSIWACSTYLLMSLFIIIFQTGKGRNPSQFYVHDQALIWNKLLNLSLFSKCFEVIAMRDQTIYLIGNVYYLQILK